MASWSGPIIIPRHSFAERVSLARKRGLVKKMGVNWAIAVAGGWCGWECGAQLGGRGSWWWCRHPAGLAALTDEMT